MTVTIKTVLNQARQRLAGEAQPALEAEILLAHSLDASRSFLYANPDLALPDVRLRNFNKLLLSRLNGTPIAYLTNVKEFWSLPLEVSPATLTHPAA
jgi:release factor glutamine methyltransferase